MGCLALLIVLILFHGPLLSLFGGLLGAFIAALVFLLSLGIWGIIIVIAIGVIAAVLG